MKPVVKTGLDRIIEMNFAPIRDRRVGLLCHAASIASDLRHITQVCRDAKVNVVQCFGPEHGIWADAQDMIAVTEEPVEKITGAPVRSLYGADEASLAPRPEDFADVEVLLIDLQDVGARYYTYIYTAALAVREAAKQGIPAIILDRPNPIGGCQVEGALTGLDYLSFVGMWPLPTRHGMTIGEINLLLNEREGFQGDLEIIEMSGWRRSMYFDETGLPWIQPSPNMPTLDTAIVYPGMCLLEGTTMSEGRGTTRPFELVGADFVDPFITSEALNQLNLPGIRFRPLYFEPTFHKFSGGSIGGIGLHVTDRLAFQPLRMGLHFLGTISRLYGSDLQWRTEVYEFVKDRLAIDLLFGGTEAREIIDRQGGFDELDALWQRWQGEAQAFCQRRVDYLRYPS